MFFKEHLTTSSQLRANPLLTDADQNEAWVKQKSLDHDVILMYNDENLSRLHREAGWKSFLKKIPGYRWIGKRILIEDRAKRADYISRTKISIIKSFHFRNRFPDMLHFVQYNILDKIFKISGATAIVNKNM